MFRTVSLTLSLLLSSAALGTETKSEPKTEAAATPDVKQRLRELRDATNRLGEDIGKGAVQATDEAKTEFSTFNAKLEKLTQEIDTRAKEGGAKVQEDLATMLNNMSESLGKLSKKMQGTGTDTATK